MFFGPRKRIHGKLLENQTQIVKSQSQSFWQKVSHRQTGQTCQKGGGS